MKDTLDCIGGGLVESYGKDTRTINGKCLSEKFVIGDGTLDEYNLRLLTT